MANEFTVLLVDNQISVTTTVCQTIGESLQDFRLLISRDLAEVIRRPEPVNVILLSLTLLAEAGPDTLSALGGAYPQIPVILLVEERADSQTAQADSLLQALCAGAADYATLSAPGLLALGRRLARLAAGGSALPSPNEMGTGSEIDALHKSSRTLSAAWNTNSVLDNLIRHAVQAVGADSGYIASWNQSQHRGRIEAQFWNDGAAPAGPAESKASIRLDGRPVLTRALNQQQPVVVNGSSSDLTEAERLELQQGSYQAKLLAPLVVKRRTIGWIELHQNHRDQKPRMETAPLLEILANQAAIALDSLQYVQQTEQALEETAALYQVAGALATIQDSQAIISKVLREYLRVLDLKQGSVIMFDLRSQTGVVRACFSDSSAASFKKIADKAMEGRQIPLRNDPIYERLMGTFRPVVIEDTEEGRRRAWGWAGENACAIMIIPIQARDDIIGAIVAESTGQRREFSQWEISLGQVMADQLSVALQNVQLYEAEFRRRQQAETLREVSFVVGSSLDLNEVLERILDQLGRVVEYDSAAIHLIEGKQRRIIAGRGFPEPERVIGLTYPARLDKNEPGSVVMYSRQPMVMGNIPDVYERFNERTHAPIKSWMGIPLIARDKVIGLISVDQLRPNAFKEEDMELAQAFANQVAVALENARLYQMEINELERELGIAKDIQETLLPQFVPQVPGMQICGRLQPAQQVGGDFFHFFPIDDKRLGVAIGDVSGKGIPSALYMAVAITAIDINIRNQLTPAELLNRLNETLYSRLRENKMNIALQVATFSPLSIDDSETRGAVVTIASAGMIAPIGATSHGSRMLPVSGFPLGALPSTEQHYEDEEFLLDPYTTVIFTSDGIVEAHNTAGELFGFDRLEAAIEEIIDTRHAETIAEHIIQKARDFIGEAEQSDDMTVLVVVKT